MSEKNLVIKIAFSTPEERQAIIDKIKSGIRDTITYSFEVIGDTIQILCRVAGDMALVVFGRIKDGLPWNLQNRCVCSPV